MAKCGFSSGFSSGFSTCPPRTPRPPQGPGSGGVARPTLADPIRLARPEGQPLRTLNATGASLRKTLKADG